jgi:hypothetical protein
MGTSDNWTMDTGTSIENNPDGFTSYQLPPDTENICDQIFGGYVAFFNIAGKGVQGDVWKNAYAVPGFAHGTRRLCLHFLHDEMWCRRCSRIRMWRDNETYLHQTNLRR